jgi:hypothetical protein
MNLSNALCKRELSGFYAFLIKQTSLTLGTLFKVPQVSLCEAPDKVNLAEQVPVIACLFNDEFKLNLKLWADAKALAEAVSGLRSTHLASAHAIPVIATLGDSVADLLFESCNVLSGLVRRKFSEQKMELSLAFIAHCRIFREQDLKDRRESFFQQWVTGMKVGSLTVTARYEIYFFKEYEKRRLDFLDEEFDSTGPAVEFL